jgi:uncharacterized protein YhjY with autotransporter beta-barrel domain
VLSPSVFAQTNVQVTGIVGVTYTNYSVGGAGWSAGNSSLPGFNDVLYQLFSGSCQDDCVSELNLNSVGSISSMTLSPPIAVMNGAHSHPLSRRVATDKNALYIAGDWGSDYHGSRKGNFGLAELGLGHNFGSVQVNVSLGKTWATQKLTQNGKIKADGNYLMAESLIPVASSLWATLGAYGHWGDVNVRRGYTDFLNDSQISSGKPNSKAWGVRARLDWENALQFGGGGLTPYADLSYNKVQIKGYSETGGISPIDFNARQDKITEFRLGLNTSLPLAGKVRWLTTLEGVHRFEKFSSNTTGQIFGLNIDVAGQKYRRNWVRGGLGIEGDVGGGVISVMLNATSNGETQNTWLACSYQIGF